MYEQCNFMNAYKNLLNNCSTRKLSEGDLVATDAQHHKSCLANFYKKVRALDAAKSIDDHQESILEWITIAEIKQYVQHYIEVETDVVPIFYLKDLKDLYTKGLTFHGSSKTPSTVHGSKKRYLNEFPSQLNTNQDETEAIFQSCDLLDDGMCLARATKIIRKEILFHQDNKKKEVTTKETFSTDSEQSSIRKSVQSLVEIVLHGSDLHADTKNDSKEAIMISQLLIQKSEVNPVIFTNILTKRKSTIK